MYNAIHNLSNKRLIHGIFPLPLCVYYSSLMHSKYSRGLGQRVRAISRALYHIVLFQFNTRVVQRYEIQYQSAT